MPSTSIQRVFTNNAATMKDMQVRYGLVCNDQGGIRDDVLVYRWPYGYAMVVNASNARRSSAGSMNPRARSTCRCRTRRSTRA